MEGHANGEAVLTQLRISRRTTFRAFVLGTCAVTVPSLLAACGGSDEPPPVPTMSQGTASTTQPTSGDEASDDSTTEGPQGELTILQPLEIRHLDSSIWPGNIIQSASLLVMEPVVRRGEDLEIHPFLAEKFEFVDNTTLRLTLRQNVPFHNGSILTVEDVVFTYRRVLDPNSMSGHARFMTTVASVDAIDDSTVEIRLSTPDARILGRLALIGIVSKAVVEEVGDEAYDADPVGTGPYTLKQWERGTQLTFEAFPDYWQGPPKIQTVTIRSVLEDSTRVAELLSGGADIVVNVPSQSVPEIERSDIAEIQAVTSLRTIFAFLNTHYPPFDDIRMRKAVNYAIDRQLIIDGVLDGFGVANHQLCTAEVLGYDPQLEGYYEYDPERARALMEEAGYGGGVEVNFFYPPGRYLKGDEVVANLVEQLAQLGITAKVHPLEFQTYQQNYMDQLAPDLHIGMWSNANDTLELDYNLQINVHTVSRGHYWGGPEIDQKIDEAIATIDRDERERLYRAIARQMVEEAVWLFLYNQADIYGVSRRVRDWKARPDEVIYVYGASVVDA